MLHYRGSPFPGSALEDEGVRVAAETQEGTLASVRAREAGSNNHAAGELDHLFCSGGESVHDADKTCQSLRWRREERDERATRVGDNAASATRGRKSDDGRPNRMSLWHNCRPLKRFAQLLRLVDKGIDSTAKHRKAAVHKGHLRLALLGLSHFASHYFSRMDVT